MLKQPALLADNLIPPGALIITTLFSSFLKIDEVVYGQCAILHSLVLPLWQR